MTDAQPKILTQIGIVHDYGGLGEVAYTPLPDANFKNRGRMSVVVEIHDQATNRDHYIQIEGVKHVKQQSRESLFPPRQIVEGGKPLENAPPAPADAEEVRKLREKVSELERNLRDQSALIKKQKVEMDAMKVEVLALSEKIHAVEVWTFDQNGVISNHYVLDTTDLGEEIPIGNVVVKLNPEAP